MAVLGDRGAPARGRAAARSRAAQPRASASAPSRPAAPDRAIRACRRRAATRRAAAGLRSRPWGLASQRPAAPATSSRRIRRATTRGDQEIVAQEIGERVADPVLVARDDRGVRDRQAERVAEQRGHREPVGQPADHRRFGKGADKAPGRMTIAQRARDQKKPGHRHQQRGRDHPHAPERRRRGGRAGKAEQLATQSFNRAKVQAIPSRARDVFTAT